MNPLHLSEPEIQQAAEAAALPPAAAGHLRACPTCQARVADYQGLFTALAQQPRPAFAFDVAAAVLAQLPAARPAPSAFPWVVALIVGLVLGVILAFLVLFGGLLAPVFQSLSTGLGAGLVTVAGFFVAVQCLELLARHRQQMRQLNFS